MYPHTTFPTFSRPVSAQEGKPALYALGTLPRGRSHFFATGIRHRCPPPGCKTQVYPHTTFLGFSRPGKPHSHVAKSNYGRCRGFRLENRRFSLKIVQQSIFWNLNSEALTRRTPKNTEKSSNRPSVLYNKPQEPLKHYGAPTLAATLQPSKKHENVEKVCIICEEGCQTTDTQLR